MKLLITGGTGFVGRHLVTLFETTEHEITIVARSIDRSLFATKVGCIEADITNAEVIMAAITSVKPDVVIHSAAISKPNDCELQQSLCYSVNVQGTQHVIDACRAVGARLIFMSTDFVFGHYGPYSEMDAYCPVNYYGQSKVLAEGLVLASGLKTAVVRTVMVYGKPLAGQAGTFLHWVKNNLEQEKTIRVFTDQYRSVTFVNDLCIGIKSIVDKGFEGIVHLCGEQIFTPFQLAGEVAAYCGYAVDLIQPVTKLTFPEVAERPENSVLLIDVAKTQLNYSPTPLSAALPQIFGG